MMRVRVVPCLLAFLGIAVAAASDPQPVPAPAAPPSPPFEGRQLLERYRQLPACKIRVTADWQGAQASGSLLYRRPGRFLAHWEGLGQTMQLVSSPAEHRVYYPQEQEYLDLGRVSGNDRLWDSFSNPIRSLAALLEPRPADAAVIERIWLPRLKPQDPVKEGGITWLRFDGRGANGARMQLWVSPDDRLIHRVRLQDPSAPPEAACTIRIEIELPAQLPPETAFRLKIPRAARDMQEPEDVRADMDGPPVGRLRARLIAKPRDAAGARALTLALMEAGESGEALRTALELDRREPSASARALVAHVYLAIGARQAALETVVEGLVQYGPAADPAEDLYMLLLAAANASPRAGELAAKMEAALKGRAGAGAYRLVLAQLYRRSRQPARAVEQVLAALDEPEAKKPAPAAALGGAPVDAVPQAMGVLAELGASLSAAERKQAAASLRRLEGRMPAEAEPFLVSAYLALDDPASAERVASELLSSGEPTWILLARIADAQAKKGASPIADRLYRQALLDALETEPVENQFILHILQFDTARSFLAPVFRRLAAEEQAETPLQAAHWLFFTGDLAAAGRAYEEFLASPRGSTESASPVDRLTAICLAARCARDLKQDAKADALVVSSISDLATLRSDLPRGTPIQPFVPVLLDSASSPRAREQLCDKAGEVAPDALLEWLVSGIYSGGSPDFGRRGRDGGAGGGARQEEIKGLIRRLAARNDAAWGNPEMLVQTLLAVGLAREAATIYLRFIRQNPARLNPDLIGTLAGMIESSQGESDRPGGPVKQRAGVSQPPEAAAGAADAGSAPAAAPGKPKVDPLVRELIAELEAAIRRRPDGSSAELTLAQWYTGHEQAARAIQIFNRIVKRKPTAENLALLGQAEVAAGKLSQGLAHLDSAVRLAPKNEEMRYQFLSALEQAGKKTEALAWWRRLKTTAATAGEVQMVANGLRSLGREAEARAFVVERYESVRLAERYPGEANSLRTEVADSYLSRKQPERALALFPEVALFELNVAPEALRSVNFDLPPSLWQVLIAQYDRAGKRRPAFLAYSRAIVSGGLDADEGAFRRLIERARQLGDLQAATEMLRAKIAAEGGQSGRGNPAVRAALASVEEEAGHPDAAAAYYRQVLHPAGDPYPHSSPGAARAAASLALLFQRQGKQEEAERYRRWGEAMTLLEEATGRNTDGQKVLTALQRAQKLWPESPCVQAAIARYEPAPKDGRNDPVALRALELMLPVCGGAEGCTHCGTLLTNRSAPGGPGLPFERLMAVTHESGAALLLRAAAESPWKPLAPADALVMWRKVVEREPGLVAAWEALRTAAEQQDDVQAGIEASEKVATLRRDSADEWLHYAGALMRAGRRAEARTAALKAGELDPEMDVSSWTADSQMFDTPQAEQELMALFASYQFYGGLLLPMEPW